MLNNMCLESRTIRFLITFLASSTIRLINLGYINVDIVTCNQAHDERPQQEHNGQSGGSSRVGESSFSNEILDAEPFTQRLLHSKG